MSDTPKTDTMLSYLSKQNVKTTDAIVGYVKRMHASGLGTPTLEMVKDFVAVLRDERVPQHLQGDGFDWLTND